MFRKKENSKYKKVKEEIKDNKNTNNITSELPIQTDSEYISTCKTCGKAYNSKSETNECSECMFKSQTENNLSKIKRNKFVLIFFGILALLLIVFLILSIQFDNSSFSENRLNNITKTKLEISKLSFTKYLVGNNISYPNNFSEIVYLSQETIHTTNETAIIYKYVEDDFGNKIKASRSLSIIRQFDYLFPEAGKTNDTYLVTGNILLVNDILTVDIDSIVKKDIPLVNVSYVEQQITQVNTTVESKMKLNFTKGINTLLGR